MTRRTWWLLAFAVAGLALAASVNSIANGYAYDDVALIPTSPRVKSWAGWWQDFAQTYWPGADGYRPLTILGWRAQWALGSGSPAAFHTVNVSLHVATSVIMFWLAGAVLPLVAAWVAAALYAVHPVHVEAIANVVGQSELVVALLVVLALGLYVHGRARGPVTPRGWITIGLLFLIACLFKEHAIMTPALIALAEVTVVRDTAPWRRRFETIRLPLLALALVAVGYLWVRSLVVIDGFSGFRPFIVFDALQLSTTDRILTMIGAAPEWLRLLLWPARLVVQYAPPHIEVAQGLSVSQIPGLLVLMGVLGLAIATWRRSPATSFGLGWLILALLPASNFLLPAGFIIAERTLLLPSVGAMIAVGSGLAWLHSRLPSTTPARVAAAATVALVLALGVARSFARNPVWRNNDTLYRQGVLDAPDSYVAHFHLGAHHFSNSRFREGQMHYRRAIELFPHDPLVAYSFAEQLRAAGMCDTAIPLYYWLFEVWPDSRRGHLGHAACLLQKREFERARDEALVWIQRGGRVAPAREILLAAKAGRDSVTSVREAAR